MLLDLCSSPITYFENERKKELPPKFTRRGDGLFVGCEERQNEKSAN